MLIISLDTKQHTQRPEFCKQCCNLFQAAEISDTYLPTFQFSIWADADAIQTFGNERTVH